MLIAFNFKEFIVGKQYTQISGVHQTFIRAQKLFFVGTAGCEGRVNISPKGMDSLRVLGPNRVVWLNVTGSGNESAAHVAENARMTLMFCAFEGRPMILRLYGQAEVVHPRDNLWSDLVDLFPDLPGARQVFDLTVDLVQTSCGMSVPFFDYVEQRDDLVEWAERKGEDKLVAYWHEKNEVSLDGKPTYLFDTSSKERT